MKAELVTIHKVTLAWLNSLMLVNAGQQAGNMKQHKSGCVPCYIADSMLHELMLEGG